MSLPIFLVGGIVCMLGMSGIVSPDGLLWLAGRVRTRLGLWVIAGIRLAIGGVLLLSAEASRAPVFVTVVGAISIVSGVVTPVIGVRRAGRMVDWWQDLGPLAIRAWCVVVIAFGLSLVWASFPPDVATP
ncbi:MAG: hypothetical protein QNK05_14670 [Myxococcota bacterium]|nr:hypothetical protein [Myxococcota bacterium]